MGLNKLERKQRIKKRIRKVVNGTADKPRLVVFRSNKDIYAQLVDDIKGTTLSSVSSRDKDVEAKGNKSEVATIVGKKIAEKAMAIGIQKIAFDRGGKLYHGRIKSLAEGARETGLKF